MRIIWFFHLIVFTLAIPSHSVAEPSKPISSMMDTPSSVFDVFLFQLIEQSKCYQIKGVRLDRIKGVRLD